MAKLSVMEKKWLIKFSKKLTSTIADLDMTQSEFAEFVGLSKGTINRYLSGERSPKAYHIYKIAGALRVSVAELME